MNQSIPHAMSIRSLVTPCRDILSRHYLFIAIALLWTVALPTPKLYAAGGVTQLGTPATSFNNGDDTLENFTVDAGTDRLLVVVSSDPAATTIASVTFNGVAMTKVVEHTDSTAVDSIWVLPLGSGTAVTGNIVSPGSSDKRFIAAIAFAGVDQTTPVDDSDSRQANTSTSSTLTLTSESGDLLFDVMDTWNSGATIPTNTPNSGQTQIHSEGGAIAGGGSDRYTTSTKPGGAPTTDVGWTFSAQAILHLAININQSTVTADTTITLTGGELTISDTGSASNDNLTVSYSGGNYTIADSALTIDASAVGGGVGTSVTFADTGVTGITIDTLSGNDQVTLNALQSSLTSDFIMRGGEGSDVLTVANAISLSSAISLTAESILLNGSINTDGTSTGGAMSFTGAIQLGTDVTLDSDSSTSDGAVTLNGTIDSDATEHALTVIAGDSAVTLSSPVGNTVPLSTLILASSTHQINGGTVTTTGGQTYGGAVQLGAPATITGATLAFTSTIANNGHDLTLSNTDTASAVTGAISGSGGLTKAGSGTLTLNGVNSYSGPTAVNAGQLLVNGSTAASSAVALNNATLGGSGTLNGTVTATGNAIIAPGTSPGSLTTGDLALDSTMTVTLEINGTTAGTAYDQLNVVGTVNLDNDGGGGATLDLSFGYTPADGDSYTIIANDGGDPISGAFAGLPEGAFWQQNNTVLQITYLGGDGNDVVVTATTVPLVINEVDYDQVGTDDAEFVELKNISGAPLALGSFDLLLVEGAGGGGTVYTTIPLSNTTLAVDDYYVICGAGGLVGNCDQIVMTTTNFIQNGAPDAVAIAQNGHVIEALSYEGDSAATYVEGSGSGLADTDIDQRFGLSRFPDGADTGQNNVDFSARCISPGAANVAFNTACDQPKIALLGADVLIVNGATSVATSDDTDFGRYPLNTPITHTFTISNSGLYTLTLSGTPVITVTPNTEFTLVSAPSTAIASGASTTFGLAFTASAAGIYTATIAVENNDSDEGLYTFTVQGEAQPALAAINGIEYLSLQEAIDAAIDGDTVRVLATTLTDTATIAGLTQLGYITKSLTIEGGCDSSFTTCDPDTPTTLDAAGLGRGLVISGTIGVTLTNLIVTGGDATAAGGDGNGGGLLVDGSTVILLDTTIDGNSATNGGGLYIGSTVTCGAACTIANNSAINGGGVFINSTGVTSTFSLEGGQIVTNSATLNGGGVYVDDASAVYTQTAGLLANNSAVRSGGGLYSNAGVVTIAGGAVNNNRTTSSGFFEGGGGLYFSADTVVSVQDASIVGNGATNGYGGGILSQADLAIDNTDFISNIADRNGGALFMAGGELFLSLSTIMSNTAGAFGGGIRADLALIAETDFINNESGDLGGALSVADGTVINSLFQNNRSPLGGALHIDGDSTVDQCDFVDNAGEDGGAIYVERIATITESTFTANRATKDGGAILNDGELDLERNHFVSNVAAEEGAAVALYGYSGEGTTTGAATVINNLFRDNGSAGAVIAIDSDGVQAIYHNTIISATVGNGVAIATFGDPSVTVDIVDTIVASYTVGFAASVGTVSEEANLIFGTTTPLSGTMINVGGTLIDVDPLFRDPTNGDYRLTNFSPALDGGVYVGVDEDIDDIDRPKNEEVDIGAYETPLDVAEVNGVRYSTLQGALDAANDGDLVKVAALTLSDHNAYGGELQIGYITKSLIIEGGYDLGFVTADPAMPTTLDADYVGRGLTIQGDIAVTVTNFIITHGDVTTSDPGILTIESVAIDEHEQRSTYGRKASLATPAGIVPVSVSDNGGGILIEGSAVWLINTTVTENNASFGGGVAVGSTLYCDASCTIANNSALEGGGVFLSTTATTSTLVLNGGQIISNTAYEAGGGLFLSGPTTYITMTAGTIADNLALIAGGGVLLDYGVADLVGGTIENNVASDTEYGDGYGGGFYQYGGELRLAGTIIRNNRADYYGGGLYLDDGVTTITNTLITANQTITDDGGGIYVDGGFLTIANSQVVTNSAGNDGGGLFAEEFYNFFYAPITITNSLFQANDAGDSGGGLYFLEYAVAYITDTQILNNTALDDGGALKVNNSELTLIDSTVQGNQTEDSGAGIYVEYSLATIDNTTIIDNHALDDGGGLKLFDYAEVMLSDSIIQDNSAYSYGGGIVNDASYLAITNTTISGNQVYLATDPNAGGGIDSFGGELTVENSTVANNTTTTGGGGIALGSGDIVTLTNMTLSGNRAASGGGIFLIDGATAAYLNNVSVVSNTATSMGGGVTIAAADLTLANTLIGNNLASSGNDCFGDVTSQGNNLIEDPSDCTGLVGSDLTNVDPAVGPLQNNGGDTTTHALLVGSPALDRANAATCATTDQRLVDRPQGAGCDIGAFELIQPEIAILGNNVTIVDGALSASLADHTDFAAVKLGDAITRTFTISNSGQADLLLTDPSLVQITASTPFALVTSPAATIAPTDTTTFQIRFMPVAQGIFTATVTVSSNDVDERDYDFVIAGMAYDDPTMVKLATPDPVAAGAALTYTLVITNGSPLTITNAIISDTLPAAATLVAGSVRIDPAQASATLAATDGDLPTLASGLTISPTTTITLTYAVTTATSYTGTLVNTAQLSTTTPAVSSRTTVTSTVWRNALTIGDATVTEGDNGNRFLTSVVSRTHNLNAVTVDFATSDDTATAGSDYDATSGSLAFTAGSALTTTITVTVSGDLQVEGDETLTVTLSNATGGVIDGAEGVGTIVDDDSAIITLTGGSTQEEGDSGFVLYTFTATVDSAVQGGFTLRYGTNDGSATVADSDYVANSGTVTFTGTLSESQLITVSVIGDGKIEADETFSVALGTIGGTAIPSTAFTVDSTASVATIRNDDRATVAVVPTADSTAETAGTYLVTLQLSSTNPVTLTAPITVVLSDPQSGSASAGGVDYSFTTPTTITVPAGVTSGDDITAALTLVDDGLAEGNETVHLLLTDVVDPLGAVAVESGADQMALTIADNDNAYQIVADQSTVSEGDSGVTTISFTVTRTGAITSTTGTVNIDFSGSATNGSDYNNIIPATQQIFFGDLATTATVTIDVIGDLIDESNEVVTAMLITPTIFPASGTATIAVASASTTILDDDTAAILLSGDSATALVEGSVARTFTVTLQTIPTATVTITLTPDSQLDTGSGGATPITLTFDPDSSALLGQTFTVSAVDDPIVEAAIHSGQITVDVASADDHYQSQTVTPLTLSIQDNDSAELSIADATVQEGDSGTTTVALTVTLDNEVDLPFTVDYATGDNSATTADNDYLASSGVVTFTGGAGESQFITITINGDTKIEAYEQLTVTVSNLTVIGGSRAVTIADADASVTILDDESASVAFALPSSNASEETGDHVVAIVLTSTQTVTLTQPISVVVVDSFSGNATASGVDYSLSSLTTVTFPAGSATGNVVTVTLKINNDALVEGDETLALAIQSVIDPLDGVQLATSQTDHTITLIDNDIAYQLQADQATVIEGDSGTTTINFTITRTGAITTTSGTVDFVLGGAATAGIDYANLVPVDQQVSFAVGETTTQFTLDVLGDQIDEADEAITARLTAPIVSATLGTALITGSTQQTTILDDDNANIIVTGDSVTPLTEGDPARTFTVTLQSVPTATVAVTIFIDDQLDLGGGAGVPITLTFAADSSALTPQTFTVTAVDDAIVEAASLSSTLIFAVTSVDSHYDGFAVSEIPLTVLDNDSAQLTIADATMTEGDSGIATVALTITLDNAVDLPFTVDYVTGDNSATTADSDYLAGSGVVTFTGGAGESQFITITINGDTKVEADEQLTVTLNNLTVIGGSRAVTIGDSDASVTIVTDDQAIVTLGGGTVQDEGDSGITHYVFTATLDSAVDGGFAVDYQSSDGSATVADGDYVATSGTLIFAGIAGEQQPITATVNGDTIVELDETFAVALEPITGTLAAAIITDGTPQQATIRNDDSATIALIGTTVVEGDSGITAAILTATLDAVVDSAITLTYSTADGSATVADSDYQATTGSLAFGGALGESLLITLPVFGDPMVEADETVSVTLSALNAGGRAVSLAPASALVTILNDDQAILNIADVTSDEGDSGQTPFTFTLTLDQSLSEDVTVDVSTMDGTASSGSDFDALTGQVITISAGLTTTNVFVAVNGDTTVEADETFTVTLSQPRLGGSIDSSRLIVGDGNGLGTLVNDDLAAITMQGTAAPEGDSLTTGFVMSFTLLAGVDGGFQLPYSTQDLTATAADQDYTPVSGTLTFVGNPGEVQTVTVPGVGDITVEADETFELRPGVITGTVLAGSVFVRDPLPLVVIENDDQTELSVADVTVNEGDGSAAFVLDLSAPSDAPIAVAYQTTDGSALAGADYSATSGTIVIPAAALTTTVAVPINNDTLDELTEQFTLNLSLPSPLITVTVSDGSAQGTILDNDAPPSMTIGDASGIENGGPLAFVIALSAPSGLAIGVDYATQDNSAVAGQDFVAASGHVTLTAGMTMTTVPITLINDDRFELPEQFQLVLSNPTNGTLADDSATGAIADDDPTPILSIADRAVLEGDSGTQSLLFTVTLSNSLAAGFSVDYQTQDGNATAGEDYAATSGFLNFAGDDGETRTIAVTINGDTTIENDETFTVSLTNLQSGPYTITLATGGGRGTILNDDLPPNLPPVAVNDAVTTTEGSALAIAPLQNDSDPESGPLTIVAVGLPTVGAVVQNSTLLTYTPPVDLIGTAIFTYTIADDRDQRATAQVTVQIIDQVPTAASLVLTVTNDANGDGIFTQQESATLLPVTQQIAQVTAAASDSFGPLVIPIQVTLANTGNEALTIQSVQGTAVALAGSACAAWVGTQIAPTVTQQCVYTLTVAGDDNLTVTERVGIVVADNERNQLSAMDMTMFTTPDLAPQIELTALDSSANDLTVLVGDMISCTALIDNLTAEALTLQPLQFVVEHTVALDSSITTIPVTTPAACSSPLTLDGLGKASCLATVAVPANAHNGDTLQCSTTAVADDDDGGRDTVTNATDRYIVVDTPTNLVEKPESALPIKVFLPLVAAE